MVNGYHAPRPSLHYAQFSQVKRAYEAVQKRRQKLDLTKGLRTYTSLGFRGLGDGGLGFRAWGLFCNFFGHCMDDEGVLS